MKKLLAFILLICMFTLVSCTGGEPEEPISTGATGSSVKEVACSVITVDETGFMTRIVEVMYADVENADGSNVTVLDAVTKIFNDNDVKFEVKDDRIVSIRGKAENTVDGYKYVWEYKINGHEVTTPANEMLVGEEDHIIYYLTPYEE